jgi:transcription initiation factor IIE alpha subunit
MINLQVAKSLNHHTMEINYKCPKCKSYLNIGDRIVLSAKVDERQKGLLLFSNELGNYQVKKHDLIQYKKGQKIGFYCPICHSNLAAEDLNLNLVKVIMEENGKEYTVLFSNIAGEHATYKLHEKKYEAYGKDKDKYINFLGF